LSYLADYHLPAPLRRTLESLVPVVCPPEAVELGLAQRIVAESELTIRSFQAGARAALVAGITSYELLAAGWPGHLGRTASRLSPTAHERYFARWWGSPLLPLREFAKGIKGMLAIACYEQQEIKDLIGYNPERWIEKSRSHRLATYSRAIEKHRSDLLAPDPLPGVPEARSQRWAG